MFSLESLEWATKILEHEIQHLDKATKEKYIKNIILNGSRSTHFVHMNSDNIHDIFCENIDSILELLQFLKEEYKGNPTDQLADFEQFKAWSIYVALDFVASRIEFN